MSRRGVALLLTCGLVAMGASCSAHAACLVAEQCLPPAREVRAVASSGNLLVYARGRNAVGFVDISRPADRWKPAEVRTPGEVVGVAIAGERVYVVEHDFGMHVIDVGRGRGPAIVGAATTPCAPQAVAINGDHAYVACFSSGLVVLDVSSPEEPEPIGIIDTPGFAYGVAVEGRHAFVADFTAGLRIIDVSSPSRPVEVGALGVLKRAVDVQVGGSYAYVADAEDGMSVVDVHDVSRPEEVALVDFPSQTPHLYQRLALFEDRLVVARDRLWVMDVSVPESPRVLSDIELPDGVSGFALGSSMVIVASRSAGLVAVTDQGCGGLAVSLALPNAGTGLTTGASGGEG
jgi:hypothetical protein